MKRLRELYWTILLLGHKVDPAKGIIYNKSRHMKFRVSGTLNRQPAYDRNRLVLTLDEATGRVEKVRIG